MSESEEIWRAKSDDELLEAREDLSEYTEEGERIIRAELQRRGLPKPDPPIGSCPACGRPVAPHHQGDECAQCGEPLPPDRAKIPGGWLVVNGSDGALAFVPDPEHKWNESSS